MQKEMTQPQYNEGITLCSNGYMQYAGTHLIVEVWNGKHFNALPIIRDILTEAVAACKTTLLNIDLHEFSPYGGVSGVAIISESHISIHTWPEHNYAAIDIFVCGNVAEPYRAIDVLKKGFETNEIQVTEIKRGIFK